MASYLPPRPMADYLVGSLYWSGLAPEALGPGLARASAWLAALIGAGFEGLPFGLVHDLGHMVLLGPAFPLAVSEGLDRWPEAERSLRVAYGNGILAELRDRPWLVRAHDLVAGGGASEEAVVYCLERMVRGLAVPARWVMHPAKLPQLPWGRLAAHFQERGPGPVTREAGIAFEAWAEAPGALEAEHAGAVERAGLAGGVGALGEVELFELEHLALLPTRERRLKARQLREAELMLGRAHERTFARPPEAAEVDVDLPDEGTYPAGGLEGLSNRGTWENLLPSELVYIDEADDPDLFTVRMVEGELLYYTRDAAQLRRIRRVVHLVVEGGDAMRVKFPEHPFGLEVHAESLAARIAGDLLDAFEKDACKIVVHLVGPAGEEQRDRLGLRFAHEIRRGEVELRVEPTLDPAGLVEAKARAFLVWIGTRLPFDASRRAALLAERLDAYALVVGADLGEDGADWVLGTALDAGLVDDLEAARRRLVEAIVGGA